METKPGKTAATNVRQARLDTLRNAWDLEGTIIRMEVAMLADRKTSPYQWANVNGAI